MRTTLALMSLLPSLAFAASRAAPAPAVEADCPGGGAVLSEEAADKLWRAIAAAQDELAGATEHRRGATLANGVAVSEAAYQRGIDALDSLIVLDDAEYARRFGKTVECAGENNVACTWVARSGQRVVVTETYVKASKVESLREDQLSLVFQHEASHVMLSYAGMPLEKQEQYLAEKWPLRPKSAPS